MDYRRGADRPTTDPTCVSTLGVVTLVLWLSVMTVSIIGMCVPYSQPRLQARLQRAVKVELLNVDLTSEPLPSLDAPPQQAQAPQPPPMVAEASSLPAPALLPVAEPNPAVAFPISTDGPVRVVAATQAASSPEPAGQGTIANPAPIVQNLQYGQGEGRQPAPEYPAAARREGQEGAVVVRFTIDEQGRVVAAEAIRPAPWPLLTEAALRAVRTRWRFKGGPIRVYDVAIRFQLSR